MYICFGRDKFCCKIEHLSNIDKIRWIYQLRGMVWFSTIIIFFFISQICMYITQNLVTAAEVLRINWVITCYLLLFRSRIIMQALINMQQVGLFLKDTSTKDFFQFCKYVDETTCTKEKFQKNNKEVLHDNLDANDRFISCSKCFNRRRILKLLSNFGCLFTFCYSAQAN